MIFTQTCHLAGIYLAEDNIAGCGVEPPLFEGKADTKFSTDAHAHTSFSLGEVSPSIALHVWLGAQTVHALTTFHWSSSLSLPWVASRPFQSFLDLQIPSQSNSAPTCHITLNSVSLPWRPLPSSSHFSPQGKEGWGLGQVLLTEPFSLAEPFPMCPVGRRKRREGL